jgi:flagellar biosynthesis protein FlhF
MHYRKFCRPTVREALSAVREELGPDALVLSTRSIASPGLRGWMGARVVEVTAAVDRDQVSGERIEASANRPAEPAAPPASPLSVPLPAMARGLAARLEASGLSDTLAATIAQHPRLQDRGAGASTMREVIAEALADLAAPAEPMARVEVFIGPPGVGKTTTIAKIAAQARGLHSTRIGMVAADGFRVGAVEQLRLYADIIGSPFAIARSGADLTRALDELDQPLLVDTAGRSPRDEGAAEILDVLAARVGVRRHLVLPASTSPGQARRILDSFRTTRPDRLVLTRLDEVETLAPLISVLSDSGLRVSYLGHGQGVPEDLERATPKTLTDWVLGDRMEAACA